MIGTMRTHALTASEGRDSRARPLCSAARHRAGLHGAARGPVVPRDPSEAPSSIVRAARCRRPRCSSPTRRRDVPRSIDTDAEGRYEASNLQPGTYKVEVLTTSFKKFEKTGVLVRASGNALVDVTLEVGNMNETVTVTAEAQNNITLDSPSISRGLDAQQLRDLPRSTPRHPVVPAAQPERRRRQRHRHPVPRARRPTACRTSRTARPRPTPSSARSATRRRASTRSRRSRCCRIRSAPSTAASPASSSRPSAASNAYHGTAFYDFNNDGLNALTYNQTLSGVERGRPTVEDARAPVGRQLLAVRSFGSKLFFFGNYEGSNDKAIYGGSRATRPDAGDARTATSAARRFTRRIR